MVEVTNWAVLSVYSPRLVPGYLYSQPYARHLRDFGQILLFDHMCRIEGMHFLCALLGFQVLPPFLTRLFGDCCLNFLSVCVPCVLVCRRVAPWVTLDHSPGRLVVWIFQEA